LIDGLVREEARRFPALAPGGGWRQADLEDLLGDFLADRVEAVTANLMALAHDDASMGRLLRKSIRHWLIDKARGTGVGALRRALDAVLASEGSFERVPVGEAGAGRWRLAGTSAPPWSGAVGDLLDAARAVPNVKIPKWSSSTRRAPVADRVSLVAVARAVLGAAGGSLEVAQLVEVFAARFPVVLDPVEVPLPADPEAGARGAGDDGGPTPEDLVIAAEDEFSAAVAAAEIVGMLSVEERRIVPYLHTPQAVQEVLGCGRSQAYHRVARLTEKLAQLGGDSEDRWAVGQEVIRLCGGAAGTD
jgi:hypothetical protein